MGCSELPSEYQPKRTQSNWLLTGHCYREGFVAALPTSTLCKLVQHKANQRGLGCWLVVRGTPRPQERGWARAQGDQAGGIWASQLSLCSHHLLNTRTSLSWLSRWQGELGSGHLWGGCRWADPHESGAAARQPVGQRSALVILDQQTLLRVTAGAQGAGLTGRPFQACGGGTCPLTLPWPKHLR